MDKAGRAPGPARRPADKARIGRHFRAYSDRFATPSEAFSRDVIARVECRFAAGPRPPSRDRQDAGSAAVSGSPGGGEMGRPSRRTLSGPSNRTASRAKAAVAWTSVRVCSTASTPWSRSRSPSGVLPGWPSRSWRSAAAARRGSETTSSTRPRGREGRLRRQPDPRRDDLRPPARRAGRLPLPRFPFPRGLRLQLAADQDRGFVLQGRAFRPGVREDDDADGPRIVFQGEIGHRAPVPGGTLAEVPTRPTIVTSRAPRRESRSFTEPLTTSRNPARSSVAGWPCQ